MDRNFHFQLSTWTEFGADNTVVGEYYEEACYADLGRNLTTKVLCSFVGENGDILPYWDKVGREFFPEAVSAGIIAITEVNSQQGLPEEMVSHATLHEDAIYNKYRDEFSGDDMPKGFGIFHLLVDSSKMSYWSMFVVFNWYRMLQEKVQLADTIMQLHKAGVPTNEAILGACVFERDRSSGHHTFGYYFFDTQTDEPLPNLRANWEASPRFEDKASKKIFVAGGWRYAPVLHKNNDFVRDPTFYTYNGEGKCYTNILIPERMVEATNKEWFKAMEKVLPNTTFEVPKNA